MCPVLFAAQKFLWQPVGVVSDNPLTRLGLRDPCIFSLKAVACTFSAYHNLKFTYAARFHANGDLDPTQQIPPTEQSVFLRSFAEVFRTEALELGCPARCFDLASFNSFITGQSAIDVQSEG